MSNVHDDSASGAEHPGFLQKLKDKLHIGHHKEKDTTATHDVAAKDVPAVAKPASAEPAPFPAAPVKEEVPPTKPEGEHHGGTHTFLADLPNKDLPTEETKSHLHHVTPEEAPTTPGGGVPEGGVPTFLADLPDKDLPTDETKQHLHHVTPEVHSPTPQLDSEEVPKETAGNEFYDSKEVPSAGNNEFFDSEEVFSKAQEGVHHEGVPTFLVALPEADIQAEKEKLHHVEAPEREPNTTDMVDSEEVFSTAQQGEHHGGVPTFLVALPDEEIPQEVNKGATPAVAGKADEEGSRAAPGEFDSEEVFSKAQQGEHHEGVPTFMVALPDEDVNESKQKLHHVTPDC
jgi:hypothetical protein